MKILQIVLKLQTGGAEVLVVSLAHQLTKRGYTCDICALDDGGDLTEEAEKDGLRVWTLGRREGGIDWRLIKRLYSLLKKGSYDLIHTHNFAPNFYGAPLAKLAGVRGTIYTQHGVMMFPCSRKRLTALRFLARFTDSWVTVSKSVQRDIEKYTNIPEDKFTTIINGVDTVKFSPSKQDMMKDKLGLSRYNFIIGNVARLSPEKDHETLLKSFERMREKIEKVCLIIVGDGEQRSYLEQLVQQMKLSPDVILLGNRRDVPDILKAFDIFVNSSKSEGIPLTILEAMACGLPVVATRVGGIPEIVIDGVTGSLVPSQDSAAMKDAILCLIREPEKRRQMGIAGRQHVERHFSLDAITEQYLAEYHRIAGYRRT